MAKPKLDITPEQMAEHEALKKVILTELRLFQDFLPTALGTLSFSFLLTAVANSDNLS
jgi:hypothetical protein